MQTISSEHEILDVIVVGAGINGAGIAADAAGRGLSVGLYDAGDIASATSSASSKLIHGGLRYLEQGSFSLVAKALAEREILRFKAPHLISPLRFQLPHRASLRPIWLIKLGMLIYDHLHWHNTLPASRQVSLKPLTLLKPEFDLAFEYSDCWVDDARLVLANAISAKQAGAEVRNYCTVLAAHRSQHHWQIKLLDHASQKTFTRRSKALVNATGPWVSQFIEQRHLAPKANAIRLVKGSHIVVPRLYPQDHAFILQHIDKRIVFVIPYLEQFSMIGTTDVDYHGSLRDVTIDATEQRYLIDIVNQHFVKQIALSDIIWHFSGVRPLSDDHRSSAQNASRDYQLVLDTQANHTPLLSVYGGKLTTYRKLAEAALSKLAPYLPDMGPAWTDRLPLPGGNFTMGTARLCHHLQRQHPCLSDALIKRYVAQFGSDTRAFLSSVKQREDLGQHFGHELYQREVDYFIEHEFAHTAQDILWRRTKLGLFLTPDEQATLTQYVSDKFSVQKTTPPTV